MDRRSFVGMLGSSIAATGLTSQSDAAQPQSSTQSRPNVLFMIADDMTFRTIGSLNNPEVNTPNLDRLAARGCAFTHCFHQGAWMPAVCAPSRTMLTSGLSAFRARDAAQRLSNYQPNDVNDQQSKLPNVRPANPAAEKFPLSLGDYVLWPQRFRQAGYHTYITGKWHVDDVALERCFSELGPVGPGMYRSTGLSGDAYLRPPANGPDTWSPTDTSRHGHWLDTSLVANQSPGHTQHSSELYADHVCDFLARAAKRPEPFFAYIGWNAPHDPRQAPQEFLDMYPIDKIAIPENFLPEHPFDQGDHFVRDEQLAPFPRTQRSVQVHRREYYAIITHLDRQIGRVLDALDQSGKAANTYIIFTADHGLAVGEHGLMGKTNIYECSMRIPLIIAGPGIAAGKRVDELVYQHSMFATTCELTGVQPAPQIEFPSLVPLLHGDSRPLHEAVFGYYKHFQRSVRTRTHRLILYPEAKRTQLFDLVHDPWEKRDLSDDPASAATKAELLRQLRRLQQQLGDDVQLKA
jgi:choline-sulfatase